MNCKESDFMVIYTLHIVQYTSNNPRHFCTKMVEPRTQWRQSDSFTTS